MVHFTITQVYPWPYSFPWAAIWDRLVHYISMRTPEMTHVIHTDCIYNNTRLVIK